jgi:GDPmannose 4,6-dehydratase
VQYSVRQFIEKAAAELGLTLSFEGRGVNEVGVVRRIESDRAPALKVGDVIVRVDPRYFRPAEVETLLGDPSLARKELGWVPEITLDELVREMVAHDLVQARQDALLRQHGYSVSLSKEN